MLFYVKDRKTFKTNAVLEGISWKLVRSVWTDLSEIVAKDDPNVNCDDIVFTQDNWMGIISDLERDGNKISLKAEKIEKLFSRTILYDPFWVDNTWKAEENLRYLLANIYAPGKSDPLATADPEYAMTYVNATKTTNTAGICAPALENYQMSAMSYISRIRRIQNVFTNFSISGDTLNVTIGQETKTPKILITTNVPCVIKEESFSEENVAKIMSYTVQEEQDPDTPDDPPPYFINILEWFLYTDGSFNAGVPDPAKTRAKGSWALKVLNEEEWQNHESQIADEFAKNKYTHKIIVQMQEKDARYDFYDLVKVEVGNHIYDSYVSRKTITSDGLVEYTFGDLKTSLMDKINEYD